MNQSQKELLRVQEKPLNAFLRMMSNGGILLMITAVVALVWANSPFQEYYLMVFEKLHLSVGFHNWTLDMHLLHWINDGLMAIFFFMVGLEIKREMMFGELSQIKVATLPIFAAIGGMVIPMLIYMAFGLEGEAGQGWGIPMATDIAFSIGILTLLGKRVPLMLKVFLTALAIVDDLGAVMVIAVFYTSQINWVFLLSGLGLVGLLFLANYFNVKVIRLYMVVGVVVWILFLNSGIHATIAGVLVALTIPIRPMFQRIGYLKIMRRAIDKFKDQNDEGDQKAIYNHAQLNSLDTIEMISRRLQSPLQYVEHSLHRFVNYAVLPLFALANAGIIFIHYHPVEEAPLFSMVSLAVGVSLVAGKALGIWFFTFVAVRFGMAKLPPRTGWASIWGLSFLGGIGFTMSLFIASLAFPNPIVLTQAKIGIFIGSLVAGLCGYFILKYSLRREEQN